MSITYSSGDQCKLIADPSACMSADRRRAVEGVEFQQASKGLVFRVRTVDPRFQHCHGYHCPMPCPLTGFGHLSSAQPGCNALIRKSIGALHPGLMSAQSGRQVELRVLPGLWCLWAWDRTGRASDQPVLSHNTHSLCSPRGRPDRSEKMEAQNGSPCRSV